MFSSIAYAQAGANVAKPGIGEMLFPLAIIMFVFYFLVGRPQQKKAKDHKTFLDSMKRGDQVITSGGIIGEVTGMTEQYITLEISENVRVKVLRSHIARPAKEGVPS